MGHVVFMTLCFIIIIVIIIVMHACMRFMSSKLPQAPKLAAPPVKVPQPPSPRDHGGRPQEVHAHAPSRHAYASRGGNAPHARGAAIRQEHERDDQGGRFVLYVF